ncbi:hypothetical protein D3C78_1830730 [compost metagenome]
MVEVVAGLRLATTVAPVNAGTAVAVIAAGFCRIVDARQGKAEIDAVVGGLSVAVAKCS